MYIPALDRRPVIDFWRGVARPPVVFTHVPDLTYRQKPPAEMLEMAIELISRWESTGSNLPPVFVPDFGTVTNAKPWGGKIHRTDGGQLFIEPVAETLDDALAIDPAPNPDIELALDLYDKLRHRTGRDDIRFVTPDYQGVLGTAVQVVKQEELLMGMYSEPEKVHAFLDRVCTSNIAFLQAIRKEVYVDGGVWPYIWLPQEAGIVITEDEMPLLSPDLYREFGLPYLKRISDTFGPVFIHSCGNWLHCADVLRDSGIRNLGIDFCYPYTKLQDIEAALPGLVLQPGFDFARKVEYETLADYLSAMTRQRTNSALWIAANHSPLWEVPRLTQLFARESRFLSQEPV
jgi:hypothetical protein